MGWSVLPYVVHCLFHYLLLLHFPSYTSSTLPLCSRDDSSALLQFKNSFALNTSTSFMISSWENGTNCCQWDGVTCDTMSGHVIGLDLSCSNLQGKLHPNSTLFHLTLLQQLNLAFNDFSGSSIYSGIGDLVSLTHLNLSSSSFVCDIPSTISHLSKLVSLDLTYNDELRLDPSTWNKLILNATNLEELVLNAGVNMSSIKEGSLSLLMNLSSSLVSLHMIHTGLHGNFPRDVLCLPNLQELRLSDNQDLEGELPKSNSSIPLKLLDLSDIAFSGQIPNSIGHLKSLNELWLLNCRFDGLVPLSLWNLTQLTHLSLAGNILSGEIPSLLSHLKHLTWLDLDYNNFSGQIPDVFNNITNLEYFVISNNSLGGQLPSSLFDLTQLSILDLSTNKFEGPIPSKTTEVSKLNTLTLADNLLNGTIPRWCYSLPSLSELDLSNNKLTGPISEFLSYSEIFVSL